MTTNIYQNFRIIVDKLPPQYSPNFNVDLEEIPYLNDGQIQVIKKAVSCENYMLIKGYPGTGKTETIACLVEQLVKYGKSVIITSHTHSAIDNVLIRLKHKHIKFLRIGNISRISPEIIESCEATLASHCKSPGELESLYAGYVRF